MKGWQLGAAVAAERIVGRRNLVRASRLLLDHARRDVPNRIDSNGESLVQREVARGRPSLVVVDVGANIGQWSLRLQATARATGVSSGELHLFEPALATYQKLVASREVRSPLRAIFNRCGLSDSAREAKLFKAHELAGSNSVYDFSSARKPHAVETIALRTFDEYCREHALDHVHLLKIDAEGHDFAVLSGAEVMLREHRIQSLQFEYNFRWIGARCFLRDAMEYLITYGYAVGKVTPAGIEWYRAWDPELETYREANFFAALPSSVSRFSAISWWKDG